MKTPSTLILLLALSICTSSSIALEQAYVPARTADSRPDLQGMWSNASITTLERNSRRCQKTGAG
ncbi:MAG: hypothetical protein QGG67_03055 [Gammaproteobacteria bacterium]|nr:hypothetical protein [Gammaproteobacteria bacterium]MDP6094966.1 hypothetical protein [Gammaproteobacteria bacterium]MDP7455161.1 hypothetical protein [Gammaproteobacteria bacterium]HJO12764.1 hypothetical protein [Gammaproteobacteria bacterium]